MTSLLDIGPLTKSVTIGTVEVTVHGVTPEGFFYLLDKFPALRDLFAGGVKSVGMESLREAAPASIAYALAIATTDRSKYASPTDWVEAIEQAAKVAVNLPAHYQMSLFQAAIELTFPEGIGPFMKAMDTLAASISRVSGKTTVQDTTSSKPSRRGFVTDSVGMRLGPAAPRENSLH